MAKLRDVSRHIRSKQAGPFWVTIDIWFDGQTSFDRYKDSAGLSPDVFVDLFGTDAGLVKKISVPELNLIKVSYPRATPQGGVIERDMHSGQQYVRLLDVELD
ncbi:MAG: DUF4387 domain-containing protein [Alphaproteobacteria bacterium HGW-Alphaproteobacteria-18]|nr:MAG: DUF4387 domain-containing protein [Alphaproteobacteria bacterium HGW-Alphaproteobacteria-18]